MTVQDLVGLTVGKAAERLSFRQKGFRVFILQSPDDNTGFPLCSEFTLSKVLHDRPEIADFKIAAAEDYFGEWIIRIKEAS